MTFVHQSQTLATCGDMIFKGDLSKYHPADAMTFLSHVGSDGILTVADGDCIITLAFKSGRLLDAQSSSGDEKLLRCLLHTNHINGTQVRQIQQIRRETGLSVRQILGKLDFFPLTDVQDILKQSMDEVLLQLFLLNQGSFNFTEAPVEDDGAQIQLDPDKAAFKMLPASDEYRDFVQTIQSLDRKVQVNRDDRSKAAIPMQRIVLQHASGQPTVRELLETLPFSSHDILTQIQQLVDHGAVSLLPIVKTKAPAPKNKPVLDPVFATYKQALKAVLGHPDVLPRLSAIVSFCKSYYDGMLILTAKQKEFVHCKIIRAGRDKGLVQKSVKGRLGRVDDDPVFSTVYRSGKAFFGHAFPSVLIDRFLDPHSDCECALIPMLIGPTVSIFFYARTAYRHAGVSCHNYLELLSWIVAPAQRPAVPTMPLENDGHAGPAPQAEEHSPRPNDQEQDVQNRLKKIVGRIKDLPPLPNLVSSAMNMLSDPETPLEKIEQIIGQDQALVTNLIKVGNSALYGGLQKVTTLRQVLTRLGLKTTRNLILAASTRSYFLNNHKGMRVWGLSLWQHSVESGMAARRIAEAIHFPDPEEAFISGLVHDIGKLIMLMLYPDPFKEILKLKKVGRLDSKTAETQILGYDHEQIGRLLMERWNMPECAKTCAEFHHRYDQAAKHGVAAAIVAYADYLSRQYGAKPEALSEADHAYADRAAEALHLSDPAKSSLAETVIDDFQNAELLMD